MADLLQVVDASGEPGSFELSRLPLYDSGPFGDPPDELGALAEGELWEEGPDGQQIPNVAAHSKVAKVAFEIWQAKNDWAQPFVEQWKVNIARRRGIASARLRRRSDEDSVRFWAPEGATPDVTPDINKLQSLCRKFVSVMFVDPPQPDHRPPTADDDDEDATEFAKRAQEDLQSRRRLNTIARARAAWNRASDFGSCFTHTFVDPRGGGRIPIEIEAHPAAPTVDTALMDPVTGAPIDSSEMLESRYVRADGSLTTNVGEAATRWAPDLDREILTGRHVRPIPHTVEWIWEAQGAQIGAMLPLREIRRLFPELVEQIGEDAVRKLPDAMLPEKAEDLLNSGESLNQDHRDREERRVFVLRTYYRPWSPGYEKGIHVITIGDQWVAHREEWVHETEEGEIRPLPIPLSHYKQFDEGTGSIYGVGLSQVIGGANTARAAQITSWIKHLDRLNQQKTFLPFVSSITPEQLHDPTGTVIYFNPGGEPVFPRYPDFPRDAHELYAILGQEMEDAVGLKDNLSSPDANSGRQALAIIAHSQAGLSEPRDNIEAGYLRDCEIELSLARAFLTVPQTLKWQTEGGRFKQRRWVGADLATGVDVRLKAGSLSMLTGPTKYLYAEHMNQMGLLSRDRLLEIATTGVAADIGLMDDEFRNRVRAQIAEWEDGPPDGWLEQRKAVMQKWEAQAQMTGGIDPATGQPLMPPPDPVLARIWQAIPCDDLPEIAQLRLDHMARTMAKPRYFRFPPEWRAGLDAEYQRAYAAVQMAAMAQAAAGQPADDGAEKKPGGGAQPAQSKDQRAVDAARSGQLPY